MKSLNCKRDIEAASNIIENPYAYDNNDYEHYSKIFNLPTISHKNLYKQMGNQWKSYLGVTGSFDPALNAISMGSKNITVFDINSLNVYFAYLKIAGILSLTYEEFLNYFYAINSDKYCSKYYFDKLKVELPPDILYLWENLYANYNSQQIQNLFYTKIQGTRTLDAIKEFVLPANIFLEEKEYYRLKKLLTQIKFEYHICDFGEVPRILKGRKFDVIYLSCLQNFIYDNVHGYNYLKKLKEFEKLLNDGGTIQGGYFYGDHLAENPYWYYKIIKDFEMKGYSPSEIRVSKYPYYEPDVALIKTKKSYQIFG